MTAAVKFLNEEELAEAELSKLYQMMERSWKFAVETFDPIEDSMVQYLAETADGKLYMFATPWSNDFEKTMVLNILRKKFKEDNIKRYVMVSEAWTAAYPAGMTNDKPKIMPSEHPERIEKLVLLGVDPEAQEVMQYAATIHRDSEGKRSLGERESLEMSTTVGGVMLELLGPFTQRTVQ